MDSSGFKLYGLLTYSITDTSSEITTSSTWSIGRGKLQPKASSTSLRLTVLNAMVAAWSIVIVFICLLCFCNFYYTFAH